MFSISILNLLSTTAVWSKRCIRLRAIIYLAQHKWKSFYLVDFTDLYREIYGSLYFMSVIRQDEACAFHNGLKNNPFWAENVSKCIKWMHGTVVSLSFSTSAPCESKSWWWSRDLQAVIKNLLLIMSFYCYTSYSPHTLNLTFRNHFTSKNRQKQICHTSDHASW